MRAAVVFALALTLSGCGMGRAVHETGQLADKYGCLAKELKGEASCPAADRPDEGS